MTIAAQARAQTARAHRPAQGTTEARIKDAAIRPSAVNDISTWGGRWTWNRSGSDGGSGLYVKCHGSGRGRDRHAVRPSHRVPALPQAMSTAPVRRSWFAA